MNSLHEQSAKDGNKLKQTLARESKDVHMSSVGRVLTVKESLS